jgi:hypothetical protein
MYTITQIFYYKGNPITSGSRSAGISVIANAFWLIAVSETELVMGSFASLPLVLSKTEL